jgi:DNA-binding GntR family transcriptional regulator
MDSMLTLKQHAYNFIHERLRSGAVLPGERLSDDSIAREIGISRSPVREAIGQLANEGLVELNPRKGAFVRRPSRIEMQQAYEARLALEGFVAGRAAERATDNDVADLKRINDRLRVHVDACRHRPTKIADKRLLERFLRTDLEFHEKILGIVGNQKIIEMVQECKVLAWVFVHISMEHDLHLMANTYRQHSAVLRAIRQRDAAGATTAMNYHIEKSAQAVLDRYSTSA